MKRFHRDITYVIRRNGPRFRSWYPGTPVYSRHEKRCFWITAWSDEIDNVNRKMKPKGNIHGHSAKVPKIKKW